MYTMKLPPELVTRLYRLRERHCLGPIRKQVLIAVEQYLDAMEAEYGTGEEKSGPVGALAPLPDRPSNSTSYPEPTHRRAAKS
jgi:hypothetical protein